MWATQLGVSVDKPARSIDYSGTDDNNNSSFKIKTKEKSGCYSGQQEWRLCPFDGHVGASVTHVTRCEPLNLQILLTTMNSQPRLNVSDSRGNNLTNGQRWNGKGTEVMRVELQQIMCLSFYCSEQWDPHCLTAFQWGFRPLRRKLVNRKKRKQCTLCPINDNLAFRLNLHRCGTMHERCQYVPQVEWQVLRCERLEWNNKKILPLG